MLKLYQKKEFKKSLKKYRHKQKVLNELEKVVELLIHEKVLPVKYRDHELSGNFKGIRELHLFSDDLLMYVKIEKESITLVAIGSHAELFG
ncbi:type II toxin-antitoxin system YafQ family toxin [Fastidiosibacter lacustris]|uniref:type II toxin-antitoxin system YafQ family toxin n=1 Tax=Fastidiosibacter lacustris TaxID=2056695 RepID=UPI000E3522B0|nr:type II toxin-antitoxin system YafQ family toxin [Fastidiosibacter lacustris]